jgi:hypothetical protein
VELQRGIGGRVSERTAAQKARVRPGTLIALVHPVASVVAALGLPEPTFVDVPGAQLVLLFINSRAELDVGLPAVAAALRPGAAVWAVFRKGSRAAGLDVNRDDVWAVAERLGFRPLGLLRVDDVWTAFRLKPAR